MYMEQPLGPKLFVHVPPGTSQATIAMDPFFWGGPPGVLRTHNIRADGSHAVVDIQLSPRPLTAGQVNDLRLLRAGPLPANATAQERAEREGLLAALREHLYVPTHAPLASGMIVGRDGSIWLKVPLDGELWQVVENGQVSKHVRIPRSMRVWHATSQRVWAVGLNADGVPYIVRYVLVRA
jgi:hypothetical protein